MLLVRCTGRGTRQRVNPDRFGFARGHKPRIKAVHGFATGDLVRAVVPEGKKQGTWTGRVAVRTTGSFNIKTADALVQGVLAWLGERGYPEATEAVLTEENLTFALPPELRRDLRAASAS